MAVKILAITTYSKFVDLHPDVAKEILGSPPLLRQSMKLVFWQM